MNLSPKTVEVKFEGEQTREYHLNNTYCLVVPHLNTMPFPELLIRAIEFGTTRSDGFEYRNCVESRSFLTLVYKRRGT